MTDLLKAAEWRSSDCPSHVAADEVAVSPSVPFCRWLAADANDGYLAVATVTETFASAAENVIHIIDRKTRDVVRQITQDSWACTAGEWVTRMNLSPKGTVVAFSTTRCRVVVHSAAPNDCRRLNSVMVQHSKHKPRTPAGADNSITDLTWGFKGVYSSDQAGLVLEFDWLNAFTPEVLTELPAGEPVLQLSSNSFLPVNSVPSTAGSDLDADASASVDLDAGLKDSLLLVTTPRRSLLWNLLNRMVITIGLKVPPASATQLLGGVFGYGTGSVVLCYSDNTLWRSDPVHSRHLLRGAVHGRASAHPPLPPATAERMSVVVEAWRKMGPKGGSGGFGWLLGGYDAGYGRGEGCEGAAGYRVYSLDGDCVVFANGRRLVVYDLARRRWVLEVDGEHALKVSAPPVHGRISDALSFVSTYPASFTPILTNPTTTGCLLVTFPAHTRMAVLSSRPNTSIPLLTRKPPKPTILRQHSPARCLPRAVFAVQTAAAAAIVVAAAASNPPAQSPAGTPSPPPRPGPARSGYGMLAKYLQDAMPLGVGAGGGERGGPLGAAVWRGFAAGGVREAQAARQPPRGSPGPGGSFCAEEAAGGAEDPQGSPLETGTPASSSASGGAAEHDDSLDFLSAFAFVAPVRPAPAAARARKKAGAPPQNPENLENPRKPRGKSAGDPPKASERRRRQQPPDAGGKAGGGKKKRRAAAAARPPSPAVVASRPAGNDARNAVLNDLGNNTGSAVSNDPVNRNNTQNFVLHDVARNTESTASDNPVNRNSTPSPLSSAPGKEGAEARAAAAAALEELVLAPLGLGRGAEPVRIPRQVRGKKKRRAGAAHPPSPVLAICPVDCSTRSSVHDLAYSTQKSPLSNGPVDTTQSPVSNDLVNNTPIPGFNDLAHPPTVISQQAAPTQHPAPADSSDAGPLPSQPAADPLLSPAQAAARQPVAGTALPSEERAPAPPAQRLPDGPPAYPLSPDPCRVAKPTRRSGSGAATAEEESEPNPVLSGTFQSPAPPDLDSTPAAEADRDPFSGCATPPLEAQADPFAAAEKPPKKHAKGGKTRKSRAGGGGDAPGGLDWVVKGEFLKGNLAAPPAEGAAAWGGIPADATCGGASKTADLSLAELTDVARHVEAHGVFSRRIGVLFGESKRETDRRHAARVQELRREAADRASIAAMLSVAAVALAGEDGNPFVLRRDSRNAAAAAAACAVLAAACTEARAEHRRRRTARVCLDLLHHHVLWPVYDYVEAVEREAARKRRGAGAAQPPPLQRAGSSGNLYPSASDAASDASVASTLSCIVHQQQSQRRIRDPEGDDLFLALQRTTIRRQAVGSMASAAALVVLSVGSAQCAETRVAAVATRAQDNIASAMMKWVFEISTATFDLSDPRPKMLLPAPSRPVADSFDKVAWHEFVSEAIRDVVPEGSDQMLEDELRKACKPMLERHRAELAGLQDFTRKATVLEHQRSPLVRSEWGEKELIPGTDPEPWAVVPSPDLPITNLNPSKDPDLLPAPSLVWKDPSWHVGEWMYSTGSRYHWDPACTMFSILRKRVWTRHLVCPRTRQKHNDLKQKQLHELRRHVEDVTKELLQQAEDSSMMAFFPA
ncbi:hypothetical protein DIPPA_05723 [Diplonema papillatum]|nr:hypothetical protein DIPPA_05723 [Diplonema papillatum]